MKVFILCLCIFFSSASYVMAADTKHPLEWNKKEIETYMVMTLNKFIQENAPFASPDDAGMLITCNMAAGMQVLRNEGIIYDFSVTLLKKPDSDEVNFQVKVVQDVGDKGIVFKFKLDREPTPAASKSKVQMLVKA